MKLTKENYYSPEANMAYMSYSQFKDFAGSLGRKGCEAKAMAKLRGEWVEEPSTAMLVGSYVDAWFEGTLDKLKENNPQMFTQKGDLKADFKKAEKIIERVQRDPLFMKYMSGQTQVIMTAELFGIMWKAKFDSYHAGICNVDLKVVKDLNESFYVKDMGKTNFVEYWGYDGQIALYQAVIEKNTGLKLPSYIAGVDKKEFPNLEIIGFTQVELNSALSLIEMDIKRVIQVKNGEVAPDRCEQCDYCRDTKILTKEISCQDLILQI